MGSSFSKYSDAELIVLMKGSKPESDFAFAEIYDRYAVRVNAYIRTIMNDREEAEDIFQEVFIRFFKYVKENIKDGSIIGFLIKISRNLCLNAKRDHKNTVSIDDFELPHSDSNSVDSKEFSDLLVMAMDLLDLELREPLVLRFFDELPYEEIAEILDITAARARYLVFTGKNKLKKILNPYFEEINKQ